MPLHLLAHLILDEIMTSTRLNTQSKTRFMKTAFVTPVSRKAKNRLANIMDNNDECIIEQQHNNRVFLTSMNHKNHFWVMLDKDPDWMVEL